MAAWMLYMTMFAGALGGAGVLAERGFRHLGRPVRWVWVFVMAGAVALPVGLAFAASTRAATSGAGVGAGAGAAEIAGPGGVLGGPAVWSRIPTGLGSSTADVALLAAWLAVSLILFASLRLSAWTLRRNERAWRNGRVDGHRVLVSAGFGPGVIGVVTATDGPAGLGHRLGRVAAAAHPDARGRARARRRYAAPPRRSDPGDVGAVVHSGLVAPPPAQGGDRNRL